MRSIKVRDYLLLGRRQSSGERPVVPRNGPRLRTTMTGPLTKPVCRKHSMVGPNDMATRSSNPKVPALSLSLFFCAGTTMMAMTSACRSMTTGPFVSIQCKAPANTLPSKRFALLALLRSMSLSGVRAFKQEHAPTNRERSRFCCSQHDHECCLETSNVRTKTRHPPRLGITVHMHMQQPL